MNIASTYSVEGRELTKGAGSIAAPGDSGGIFLLAYGGYWYIAGTTTASSSTHTYAAWRDTPAGWTACSQINPCP